MFASIEMDCELHDLENNVCGKYNNVFNVYLCCFSSRSNILLYYFHKKLFYIKDGIQNTFEYDLNAPLILIRRQHWTYGKRMIYVVLR